MKRYLTSLAIRTIEQYYRGEAGISDIAQVLGTTYNAVYTFLGENDLCTMEAKPQTDYSVQHLVNCFLLWIAMRTPTRR